MPESNVQSEILGTVQNLQGLSRMKGQRLEDIVLMNPTCTLNDIKYTLSAAVDHGALNEYEIEGVSYYIMLD
jgi:hypothetical protein